MHLNFQKIKHGNCLIPPSMSLSTLVFILLFTDPSYGASIWQLYKQVVGSNLYAIIVYVCVCVRGGIDTLE